MKDLKKLRRDAGLTQYALARGTDILRWKISHAELGLYKFTPEEAGRIRAFLIEVCRKKSARVLEKLAAA